MKRSVDSAGDLRAFFAAIASPHVRPYLSMEKLIKSEQFARLIQSLDDHFDDHRDTGAFVRILALLDRSRYLNLFASYLRERHPLNVTKEKGSIKVNVLKHLAGKGVKNSSTFSKFLEQQNFDGMGRQSTQSISPDSSTFIKDIDALDHPARLPGSYGHGRRK